MSSFIKHDPSAMAVPDPHLYVLAIKRDGSAWRDEVRNIKGWCWGDETSPYDVVDWVEAAKTSYAEYFESDLPDFVESGSTTIPPLEDLQALLEDIRNEPLSDYFPSHIKDRLEEWT